MCKRQRRPSKKKKETAERESTVGGVAKRVRTRGWRRAVLGVDELFSGTVGGRCEVQFSITVLGTEGRKKNYSQGMAAQLLVVSYSINMFAY